MLLWNPTVRINPFSTPASTASTFSRFSPTASPAFHAGSSVFSLPIAAALTVSFVWLDSISATSVWNRLSRGLAPRSASRSHPIVSTAAFDAGPPGWRIARTAL